MTQPLTPTQAVITAAADLAISVYGTRIAGKIRSGEIKHHHFIDAFARHAQAARLEGARAMREAAAKVARSYEEGLLPNENWPPDEREGYENGVADASGCIEGAIRSLDPLSIAEKGV